jgi:hypothetical protein
VTIAPGQSGEAIAHCDDGDKLLSGGYQQEGIGIQVSESWSFLSDEGWKVFGFNTGPTTQQIRSLALCQDVNPGNPERPTA